MATKSEKVKKPKIVKCFSKLCTHEIKEMLVEEAIKSGSKYYHPDCYQNKENIKEIIDLFVEHINPNPVFTQLRKTIDQIVYNKKIGSDYLLFGLKYYINHKIPLNYPQGLFYVIQNKDVKKAYDEEQLKKSKKEIEKSGFVVEEHLENTFSYKPTKVKGFEDILRK